MFRKPDGATFGFGGVFQELSDVRAVQTEAFDGYPGKSVVTTTWAEQDGKTSLFIIVPFESQMIRAAVIATGMAAGAGESYDKLDDVLASMAQNVSETIARAFAASIM